MARKDFDTAGEGPWSGSVEGLVLGIALLILASACGTSGASGARYDVEWFDTTEAAPATRAALEQELSQPWPDAVDVQPAATDADRMPTTLESCNDYLALADSRVRPIESGNTFAIFQGRAVYCQAVTLTLAAQPAAISYLRPFAFDEGLPDRLPWQVAMIVSSSEAQRIADERPDATWRQALFGPLTEFSSCGTHCGRYADPGAEQWMRLLARGDFDGDGIEDMLLSSSDAAIGGSYRATRMFVLTRRQPDGKVELIRELDY
ncbi:hypothetical protein ACOPJQ_13155 [Luteimonas dalianensis]|uniref:hypothetical protein n=1 Tax=Luteimonas dalianensis TaxID=1148196 RepID=UPI003BF165D6